MIQTISVVIPSVGSRQNLVRIVDSIRAQVIDPNQLEVIIVLNGVSEAHGEELKNAIGPCAFLLVITRLAGRGVNRARNRGIDLAKGTLLLFLDDDCSLINRNFLGLHMSAHLHSPLVFAIGGGYALTDSKGFFDRVYNYLQMRWLTLGSPNESAHFLLGGNFSVKSSLLSENGLRFDDEIAYGGSEYEFFVKADLLGLAMLSHLPDVAHHTGESLRSLTRKHSLQGRGAAIIDSKYPNRKAVGGKSVTDSSQSLLTNLFLLYFNYVFWGGYHAHQKKPFRLITRILGDIFRALNFYRYEILKKISRQISDKNRDS